MAHEASSARDTAFNDGVEACIAAVVEEFGAEAGFTDRIVGILSDVKVETVAESSFSKADEVRPAPHMRAATSIEELHG